MATDEKLKHRGKKNISTAIIIPKWPSNRYFTLTELKLFQNKVVHGAVSALLSAFHINYDYEIGQSQCILSTVITENGMFYFD